MTRFLAYFFSVVCHPLLIVTYMLVILLMVNPYLFGVHSIAEGKLLVLLVFLSTFLIPAFSVLMMKALGLIESIHMHDQQERIGPYIITGIFYMWLFRNLYGNPDIPLAFTTFVLGATIGLFFAFFINLFSKISMHGVGMGGLLGMTVITMLLFSYGYFIIEMPVLGSVLISMNTLLMVIILLTGIVGTSRLFLNAHDPADLYGGFFIGLATQFIAFQLLL